MAPVKHQFSKVVNTVFLSLEVDVSITGNFYNVEKDHRDRITNSGCFVILTAAVNLCEARCAYCIHGEQCVPRTKPVPF